MSYAFVNQLDYSQATGASSINTASGPGGPNATHSVTAGNLLIVTTFAAAVPTLTDALGNWSGAAANYSLGNNLYAWAVLSGYTGTNSYSLAATGNVLGQVLASQYSGVGSATATATGQQYQNGPTPGANCFVAPASAVTLTTGSYLLYGQCLVEAGSEYATAGTSPISFTGRGNVWANLSGYSFNSEDAAVTSTGGTYQVTFGSSGYYQAITNLLAFPVGSSVQPVIPGGPMPRQIYVMP